MKLYNTLSRSLEEFKPLKDEVGIYSCGPTVYWNQHIGHMYAYVHWDSLVRTFRYLGYPVKWVMNITDVGHLVSDEDEGEDKMEKGAKREGMTVWQIADKYIAQFKESMEKLNITPPDVLCRATEHIDDQIRLIEKIEKNDFAYMTKTGLVFDTGKFPGYAKFANLDLSKQDAGARVEVDREKKNPWDFLLWVTNQPEHIMKWDSPWGVGFPGWHIECTAMSTKYLGETFDIHTGGKEHIAVHHTNEIAQGFGAFGHQTANYWLHNEWMTLDGQKISKSLGNSVLVTDIEAKGFDPKALRYLILTSHYRTGLDFKWESLEASQKALFRLRNMISAWKMGEISENSRGFKDGFVAALENDLNMAGALAIVWEVTKSALDDGEKKALILEFDKVLGLDLNSGSNETVIVPDEIAELVQKRTVAKSGKNYEEADRLRLEIEKGGYRVKDTPDGVLVTKI